MNKFERFYPQIFISCFGKVKNFEIVEFVNQKIHIL